MVYDLILSDTFHEQYHLSSISLLRGKSYRRNVPIAPIVKQALNLNFHDAKSDLDHIQYQNLVLTEKCSILQWVPSLVLTDIRDHLQNQDEKTFQPEKQRSSDPSCVKQTLRDKLDFWLDSYQG